MSASGRDSKPIQFDQLNPSHQVSSSRIDTMRHNSGIVTEFMHREQDLANIVHRVVRISHISIISCTRMI